MKNAGAQIKSWTGGCHSMLPPDDIQKNQYVWGINVVNRGGIVQTRPGFNYISGIQGSNIQGATIFTPKDSSPMMLVAVDGYIYRAKFPFKDFVRIENIKFVSNAKFVVFQPVTKSVKLNPDGSLSLIDPLPLVIIQDGKTTAGVYDGIKGKHVQNIAPFYGPPIGLWMAWAGNRLWVASKNRVYASDLENPDTFSEDTYIAERSAFTLPDECTGLIETSDEKSLLAFTQDTTTALKSNIRDRSQWQSTPEFQKVIVKYLGSVSGRSPINQYGSTWWMSKAGFVSLDAALFTNQTSKIVTMDDEMMRSKRVFAHILDTICSTAFENYLLVSVPAGGKHNGQTWAADQTPTAKSSATVNMAWCGIWTGIRPVQWMRTKFGGRERLYCVTYDETAKDGTNIHVWETFKQDRRDNRSAISCQWETGMIMGADISRFQYAEVDLTEILGEVSLKIFVGGFRGPWHLIKEMKLQAEIGSLGSSVQEILTKDTIIQSFKPQSRVIKTEDFSAQDKGCSAESKLAAGRDKGFQLLFEWKGRMGVKAVNIFVDPDSSKDGGECTGSEEGQVNIVTDEGESINITS